MRRGIYLVANYKSEALCKNLIYSIRRAGCSLPIRLIHFGGEPIHCTYTLGEVEFLQATQFSKEANEFIALLQTVLTDCPTGFLYRFLAWFSDWDEFIYADNDIVALNDWTTLFDFLPGYDLVHADEEYTTKGIYNYDEPASIQKRFGSDALESAITAGHFVATRNPKMIEDFSKAVDWFKLNPAIPKRHDQALLHVASLIGKWQVLNLCKPPHNWLSSWAGDYKDGLTIIQQLQLKRSNISHLHYSGGTPSGLKPIDDLLFSSLPESQRLNEYVKRIAKTKLGMSYYLSFRNKVVRKLRTLKSK